MSVYPTTDDLIEAFYEARREVDRQRDDDPARRPTDLIIAEAFERHGFTIAIKALDDERIAMVEALAIVPQPPTEESRDRDE